MTSVAGVALQAVGPAAIIGIIVAGLGLLQGQFGEQINSMIQLVTTQGPQIMQGLIDSIVSSLPTLMLVGSQMLVGILNAITENLPILMQGGVAILSGLIQGFNH